MFISLWPPVRAKYRANTLTALSLNISPNIWPSTKGIRKDVPDVSQVHKPLRPENSASAGGNFKITQVRIVKYCGAVSHRASSSVALDWLYPKTVLQRTTAVREVTQPVPEIRRDPYMPPEPPPPCHTGETEGDLKQRQAVFTTFLFYSPSLVLSLDIWVLELLLLMVSITQIIRSIHNNISCELGH